MKKFFFTLPVLCVAFATSAFSADDGLNATSFSDVDVSVAEDKSIRDRFARLTPNQLHIAAAAALNTWGGQVFSGGYRAKFHPGTVALDTLVCGTIRVGTTALAMAQTQASRLARENRFDNIDRAILLGNVVVGGGGSIGCQWAMQHLNDAIVAPKAEERAKTYGRKMLERRKGSPAVDEDSENSQFMGALDAIGTFQKELREAAETIQWLQSINCNGLAALLNPIVCLNKPRLLNEASIKRVNYETLIEHKLAFASKLIGKRAARYGDKLPVVYPQSGVEFEIPTKQLPG